MRPEVNLEFSEYFQDDKNQGERIKNESKKKSKHLIAIVNKNKYKARLNRMLTIVEETLGDQINAEKLESLGLYKFEEEFYKQLETLGKGGFGHVKKALDIRNRELVALKFVQQRKKDTVKDFKMRIASLLVEKQILDKVYSKHADAEKYFPKVFGVFYIQKEDSEEIRKIVLVSEAGDFNLDEIIKIREQEKMPYSEDEALRIVAHFAEAFNILQELEIYHSDIKPKNMVLSISKNSYLVIDFGLSKDASGNGKMSELINGGTIKYYSPEKEAFIKSNGKIECLSFKPFRCDSWSLGISYQELIAEGFLDPRKREIWDHLKRLNEKDAEKRMDAKELKEYLDKMKINKNCENLEEGIIKILESERYQKEGIDEVFQKYDEAEMPPNELKRIAYQQRNFKENEEESIRRLRRMGI